MIIACTSLSDCYRSDRRHARLVSPEPFVKRQPCRRLLDCPRQSKPSRQYEDALFAAGPSLSDKQSGWNSPHSGSTSRKA